MEALLVYWLHSIKQLLPTSLGKIVRLGAVNFGGVLFALLTKFTWFLVADIVIFILFGRPILQFLNSAQDIASNIHPALILLQLISAAIWFSINTIILLLLRWDSKEESSTSYIRRNFMRYINLLCAFLLIVLFFGLFLVVIGIKKNPHIQMPQVQWVFILMFKSIELFVLQYWLDSDGSFLGFFRSLERGLNFLLYNLPIIVFFMGMFWLTDFMLTSVFIGGEYALNSGAVLLNTKVERVIFENFSLVGSLHFVAFKYCKILGQYFWMSCLVVLYKRYRHYRYSKSLFDVKY